MFHKLYGKHPAFLRICNSIAEIVPFFRKIKLQHKILRKNFWMFKDYFFFFLQCRLTWVFVIGEESFSHLNSLLNERKFFITLVIKYIFFKELHTDYLNFAYHVIKNRKIKLAGQEIYKYTISERLRLFIFFSPMYFVISNLYDYFINGWKN